MNSIWINYLPRVVRSKLEGRLGLQAVLSNSTWLFADKILRMAVGLLVGIWIVRYLGPLQLGLLSYAAAFAGLFSTLATLGLDSIVIRELVNSPARKNELMGSAFVLKIIGGTVAPLMTIFAIALVRKGDTPMLWLVALSAVGFFFQSVNVIDFYFQAKVQSRYTVYATTGAFLLVTLVKVILLLNAAPLIAFAWAVLAEVVLASLFLLIVYRMNRQSMHAWRYEGRLARELLNQSWPLILSGIAIMIYMRIDQVMIGQMLDDKEVGLFSAAIRISEMWYFVPMALASSMFPTIIASKKLGEAIYYARLQKFFTVMTWIALIVAVAVTLSKDLITGFLYGPAYADSATVLAIHIWAGVFVALGVAGNSWYMVENLQKYNFYRTLMGGVANVILNFLLIPKYGIEGTAIATVISQGLASFFFDLLSSKTRPVFWLKLKAFNPLSVLHVETRAV